MIDWNSDDSIVLINPRAPEKELHESKAIQDFLKTLKGHIGIATSGSSGKMKWTALAKSAVLCSAVSVNRHLKSDSHDVWLNPLPLFHVGGLGIVARSLLSGSTCVNYEFQGNKWDGETFLREIQNVGATLTSLVPAQVFDLVKGAMKGPDSLRAIVVGGGALSDELYRSAVNLGWKLLPSYGLTECCSQVATAALGSWDREEYPPLNPLDHVKLKVNSEGILQIKSEALLSGFIERGADGYHLRDPKDEGWYPTEDIVEMCEGKLISVGRKNGFIKIGGESVDMNRLEIILQQVMLEGRYAGDAVLVPVADHRLGHIIQLKATHEMQEKVDLLVAAFNARVFPYEKIRSYAIVDAIPRTSLGKKILS